MGFEGLPLFPPQASTMSGRVDALFFFLLAVSAFFSILIAALALVPGLAHADACITNGMRVFRHDNLNIPIPDMGGASSPFIELTNANQLEVHEVVVGVEIEHSWSGDVIITLVHTPDGGPPNDVTANLRT